MPKIIFKNEQRGMAVVEIESNICSVIEILDSAELNIGDQVTGDFKNEGSTTMFNQDTYETINIIVQNAILGQDQAISRAYLR